MTDVAEKKLCDNTGHSRFAMISIFASFLIWTFLLVKKYYFFGYRDWDLAIYTQAMWNLSHGTQYLSLFDFNFFGDHANFIVFIFLPLFKLFPSALTLIVLKIAVSHLSALSLFYICRKYLSAPTACWLTITFLTFPANILANMYEFHSDCLAGLLLLWLIYFFKEKQFLKFFGVLLPTLFIKENMPLVISMFGIYALLFRREKKTLWAGIPLLLGLGCFYFFTFHLIPHFRQLETHAYVSRYQHLGNSVGEIFAQMLLHPGQTLSIIGTEQNQRFLLNLFGPFVFLSPLSPEILFFSLPLFLQHLLSQNTAEHSLLYHYAHALLPGIFLSALYTLAKLKHKISQRTLELLAAAYCALTMIHASSFMVHYRLALSYQPREIAAAKWALMEALPKKAAVIATFDFLAPLAARPEVYSFHKIYDDRFQNLAVARTTTYYIKKSFKLPDSVEYALIDFNDYYIKKYLYEKPALTKKHLEDFLNNSHWRLIKAYGSQILLQRDVNRGP